MKMQSGLAYAALLSGLLFATTAFAGNHATYVGKGPFKTGPEVTKKCMECHEKETKAFMATRHWTWSKKQMIQGEEKDFGKKNAINNFCIALPGNEPRCTSCHAGYGWKDAKFDFNKGENVDCLVCHDQTGTYKKFPSGAGHPVYAGEKKEFPKGKAWEPVDLVKVAQSIALPTRENCGSCHFFGGGGDHVKHGDLDTTLIKPTEDIDVHMGGKAKMTCVTCHMGERGHNIMGQAASVSCGFDTKNKLNCTKCHKGKVHQDETLNKHSKKVACQTCHIPLVSKTFPTKTWWDWSTAGKDMKDIAKDEYGMKVYDKAKGTFVWQKDLVPTYLWSNGQYERYTPGVKVDPKGVVKMNTTKGSRTDANSKIYPFKIMKGKQPYDVVNKEIVNVYLFGPPGSDAYWQKFDWNAAITQGMKIANRPYSGKYGFIDTCMVWPINHMVVPKSQALGCMDCHSGSKRLDWKALGYKGDPMLNPDNY